MTDDTQNASYPKPKSDPPSQDIILRLDDKGKEVNNDKSITGIWMVYFNNVADESSNFNVPKYGINLQQSDDKFHGYCIPESGPCAFKFVIHGKLMKDKTIIYMIKSHHNQYYVEAQYDGHNTIKDGIWFYDKEFSIKGGYLMAVRRGSSTELPSSIASKPIPTSNTSNTKSTLSQFASNTKNTRKRKLLQSH